MGSLSSSLRLGFGAWMIFGWGYLVSAVGQWTGRRFLFGYLTVAVSLIAVHYFAW